MVGMANGSMTIANFASLVSVNVIFIKNDRCAWFCVNNGRPSVDGGTAVMILFAT